jgi:hypothetical protein
MSDKENSANNHDLTSSKDKALAILIRGQQIDRDVFPAISTIVRGIQDAVQTPPTKRQRAAQSSMLKELDVTIQNIRNEYKTVLCLAARHSRLPNTPYVATRLRNDGERMQSGIINPPGTSELQYALSQTEEFNAESSEGSLLNSDKRKLENNTAHHYIPKLQALDQLLKLKKKDRLKLVEAWSKEGKIPTMSPRQMRRLLSQRVDGSPMHLHWNEKGPVGIMTVKEIETDLVQETHELLGRAVTRKDVKKKLNEQRARKQIASGMVAAAVSVSPSTVSNYFTTVAYLDTNVSIQFQVDCSNMEPHAPSQDHANGFCANC